MAASVTIQAHEVLKKNPARVPWIVHLRGFAPGWAKSGGSIARTRMRA